MIFSAFLASVSQILLKKSANKKHKHIIFEYLNYHVIIGYGLLVLTMILNIIAYKNIQYKLGPILNSLTYVFVMILGVAILHERITKRKIFGIILILFGILMFNL